MSEEQRQRRRVSDAAVDELRQEFRDYIKEARDYRRAMNEKLDCLGVGFKQFRADWDAKYRPHLDVRIKDEQESREFIAAKIKAWKSRAVDAGVAGFLLIVAWGALFGDWLTKAKAHVKALF